MRKRVSLLAVTVVVIALVLSGCGNGPGTDDMMDGDDMPATLPHHGTWYFADPDPADMIPLPPDARLVLDAETFKLAIGDKMGTAFTLFMTPGVTRFEVSGTYTIGADGSASFNLPMDVASAVIIEPAALALQITPNVLAAVQAIPADDTVMVVIDPANPTTVTISGAFLPGLLNLPGVTAVTACKGAPCASS